MINRIDKLKIIKNDLVHIIKYRIGLTKQKRIIWGRSPFLEYGPGIRTQRVKKYLDKETLNKNIIYIQSHWSWYEIIIYNLMGKIFRVKIIFNQNGIYFKKYNKNYLFLNKVLLIANLLSDYNIYQSNYCYKSISKISINLIKGILVKKKHTILLNPTIKRINTSPLKESGQHTILICNSFSKDRFYYSKYIYKLILNIYKNKIIDKIIVIGGIINNLEIQEINNLHKLKKVIIILGINNQKVQEILNRCTFVIHLNYGDPCPNFICEAISYEKPTILNEVGGSKEIALNSCILPKNNINYYGYKMPSIKNSIISIKDMIRDYEFYKQATKKRKEALDIKNYINTHKEIINNL